MAHDPVLFDLEFRECLACQAKPGSPVLCGPCLHNRAVIARLALHANLKKAASPNTGCSCRSLGAPSALCGLHGR